MRDLSDSELRSLASGAAEEELTRRRQERRENARKNEEAMRQQQAEAGLRSLDTDTLQALARDPRRESDSTRRKLWSSVPSSVWSGGWTKDRVVEEAQRLAQERVEEEERGRVRANAPSTVGVDPWIKIGGVAVLAGIALDKL